MLEDSAARRARLEELVEPLFRDGPTPIEQLEASLGWYEYARELAWPEDAGAEVNDSLHLPSGEALNPAAAARCVSDYLRTRAFVRGLAAALEEARRRFPGERLRVLYAGCGPLATLVLPLLSRQDPAEVGFTLVDVHGFSLDVARRLLESLALSDRVEAWIHGDACEVEGSFHVIVAEVMQRALEREPQVNLTLALAPRLALRGLWVPQEITVSAVAQGAGGPDGAPGDDWHLADLIRLTSETRAPLEATVLRVPEGLPANAALVGLMTEIRTFGDERIAPRETGITQPYLFHQLGELVPGERLRFRYRLGADPGFECEALDRESGVETTFPASPAPDLSDLEPAPETLLDDPGLARFWDRARRARRGARAWGDDELAADADHLSGIGLRLQEAMAFIFHDDPGPEEFATWVVARRKAPRTEGSER